MGNSNDSSSSDKGEKERTWRDAYNDELHEVVASKVMTDTGSPFVDLAAGIYDKYTNKKSEYEREARDLATKGGPEALKEFESKQKDLEYYDDEISLWYQLNIKYWFNNLNI